MDSENVSSPLKKCKTCGCSKPLSNFSKIGRVTGERAPRGGFGVASRCKACVSETRKPGLAAERSEKQKLTEAGLKRCGTCKQWLARSEFNRRSASADGLCFKCRGCSARTAADWREQNPSAFQDWYSENKEARAAAYKTYRERNKDRISANYAKWARANKHIVNALIAKRNAAKKQATPAWADFDAMQEIYAEAARITAETGIRHEVDHIYPLQGKTVCGLHCEANLQILTKFENIQKLNRMPEEHYEARRNLSGGSGDGPGGPGVPVQRSGVTVGEGQWT